MTRPASLSLQAPSSPITWLTTSAQAASSSLERQEALDHVDLLGLALRELELAALLVAPATVAALVDHRLQQRDHLGVRQAAVLALAARLVVTLLERREDQADDRHRTLVLRHGRGLEGVAQLLPDHRLADRRFILLHVPLARTPRKGPRRAVGHRSLDADSAPGVGCAVACGVDCVEQALDGLQGYEPLTFMNRYLSPKGHRRARAGRRHGAVRPRAGRSR